MDHPFFGGCWGRIPERRSHQRRPNPYATTSYATPVKSESASKKVVTIPINFVDSKTSKSKKAPAMDENIAAAKIQAAFLGFCVRKSRPVNKLRVIMKTKAEATEIRRRMNDKHVVELIRRDEKERMKMREWIMSLLLRLDEIQGVIPLVRESRKAVIRELINLEETVDDIIAARSRQDAATEEKTEETLRSQMQDLQIEGFPEEDNNNKAEVENFEQGSSEAGQIVSETEESTKVDKDVEILNRNKVETLVLEADASLTIPCTEEGFKIGNLRDDENSSKSLNLLKVDASLAIPCTEEGVLGNSKIAENSSESQTIQPDGKLETPDLMECEEAGDKMREKVKLIQDIGMVREENEKLKRTVYHLLKKSEKQSEMIHDLSLRILKLEEHVSQCNKTKKAGDGTEQINKIH
ncbi:hypothetical protein SUGI_0369250 [Cryptomeria japonica]|uniref:uncharacterized protein LOC131028100 n=1 Tax=Cryptomeria japonica TaxID=3369 RepID=UPI0024089484|nr:uncharacterized protein LOC131028100 [Cryptomeria japonica]GLJ20333.1 hypothetical protein SUGI_0369250 [Cryptomeria japonica]